MATYANGSPHHDILCLWFLKKTKLQFEKFLTYNLPLACAKVCDLWGLEKPPNLLKVCLGGVTCKTVQAAHGSDHDVVIAPILRRRGSDSSWAGDVLEAHHLWQAFARAKRRVYIPMGNMRGTVSWNDS